MKSILLLSIISMAAVGSAQIQSVEHLSPGLPNTGPDGSSSHPALSRDGKIIAFLSTASNLLASTPIQSESVYVLSRADQKLQRIPLPVGSSRSPLLMSGDGRYTFFHQTNPTNATGGFVFQDAYVYDRILDKNTVVSTFPDGQAANGYAVGIDVAGTQILIYVSYRFRQPSYYVRRLSDGKMTNVMTNTAGVQLTKTGGFRMTGNGEWVYFRSNDDRLPKGPNDYAIYRKRLSDGVVELIDPVAVPIYAVSYDGKVGLGPVSLNSVTHYEILDFVTKKHIALDANATSPLLVPDGSGVVATFKQGTTGFPPGTIAKFSLATKKWTKIGTIHPGISATGMNGDGSQIVGQYARPNYPFEHPQPFVTDLSGNFETFPKAVLPGGANQRPVFMAASSDGQTVAYASEASNVLPNVTNGRYQIYIRDVIGRVSTLGSQNADGIPVRGYIHQLALSADGRYLAYSLRRDLFQNTSTIVVRDLMRMKNSGTVSVPSQVRGLAVKNDGRVAYSIIEYPNSRHFFYDPKTDKNVEISLDSSGNQLRNSLQPVWVSADDDRVFFPTGDGVSLNRLFEWTPGGSPAKQVFTTPAAETLAQISDDGFIVLVASKFFDKQSYRFDRRNSTKTYLNFTSLPFSWPLMSRNGRFVYQNFVFDCENQVGWKVNGGGFEIVANDGALIGTAGGSLGGFPVPGEYGTSIETRQVVLTRLGTPDLLPLTDLARIEEPRFDGIYYTKNTALYLTALGTSWKTAAESLKFQYRIGGGTWSAPGSESVMVPLPADGKYVVQVRAVDKDGAVDATPSEVTVVRDTLVPVVKITAKPGKGSVKIGVSADSYANSILRVFPGSDYGLVAVRDQLSSFEVLYESLLLDTEYNYELKVTDYAGNQTTLTGTFRTGA